MPCPDFFPPTTYVYLPALGSFFFLFRAEFIPLRKHSRRDKHTRAALWWFFHLYNFWDPISLTFPFVYETKSTRLRGCKATFLTSSHTPPPHIWKRVCGWGRRGGGIVGGLFGRRKGVTLIYVSWKFSNVFQK